MRFSFWFHSIIAVALLMACGAVARADQVELYVDSAPNVYGSAAWGLWWTATKADVVAGTFTNMRTGTYPGSNGIDPLDEIVYSTGDLGKRIHFIYWLPGQTKASLADLFQVRWVVDWGGEDWTLVGGGWALATADNGWSSPSSWEAYSNGVIGSVGLAWWSTDGDAPPVSTNANLYDETNAADIEALRQDVFASQTFVRGEVRYRESNTAPWEVSTLQVNVVPLPSAAWAGVGLMGVIAITRLRRRAA